MSLEGEPITAGTAAGRYLAEADLAAAIADYAALLDRDQDGLADPGVGQAAIDAAENKLHGYLAKRYQLPLAASDALTMGFVKPLLLAFAHVALYLRPEMIPAQAKSAAEDAEALLAQIRDGTLDLPATSPPPAPSAGGAVHWSTGTGITMP